VRANGVVALHPAIKHLLGSSQALEALPGDQLGPQGLMEAFDLAGGGWAADPSAQVGDAVLAADAIKQPLGRVGTKPAGEDLAIEFL
jgi:hypothetical protein